MGGWQFSWVDDDTWDISVDFDDNALISIVTMSSKNLGIKLEINDFLDSEYNVFVRRLAITNTSQQFSDIRLFMHQVFQISRGGRADTALYVPDANYILDYKGGCSLLIYGMDSDCKSFDQYAVGNYRIEGKVGTYVDAEDGELSNNAVEHGGVDSTIRFKMNLRPGELKKIDYWIVAAPSQYDCEIIHNIYLRDGVDLREQTTRTFWHDWLNIGVESLKGINKDYLDTTRKSLMIIKAHVDKQGSILASGDSSIFNYGRDYYCYCWPRDGAYALWPLIRLGYQEEAKNFFKFCRDTMNQKGYMMHKYQPDRAIGSTWHPLVNENRKELAIQEDETAIVIAMLGEYFDRFKDKEFIERIYRSMLKPMADFMAKYIDSDTNLPHASYDLWEEKFLTTTYTVSIVIYALNKAAELAVVLGGKEEDINRWRGAASLIEEAFSNKLFNKELGIYRKGLHWHADGMIDYDDTLDISSVYALFMFGKDPTSNNELLLTVKEVENKLVNKYPAGGIIRYENDWYMNNSNQQQPNPWYVCTMWMAQYYIRVGDSKKAEDMLAWCLRHALPSGIFSEQIDPNTGYALGVAPLVWSHVEFINTVLDLADTTN